MIVHELDSLGEPRNGPVQQELQKRTGILTVPQVFISGKFFGDASAVDRKVDAGTLVAELQAEGVPVQTA